ncbi:MAG: hypothetical protein ABIJ18_00850 [archaeon]
MKELTKGIYSNKWTESDLGELVRVLINHDQLRQTVLLDIDGTLHQGFHDQKLRGITNADIALLLAVKGFFGGMNTKRFTKYVKDNIDLFRFEKEIPKEQKGAYERVLIERFAEILTGIPYVHFSSIARRMPERAYPLAKEGVQLTEGDKVIISKAIFPISEAYKKYIGAIQAFGCNLEIEDKRIKGLSDDCIYTGQDKRDKALQVLYSTQRVITIGDTLEDLSMGLLGREMNPESLIIAMHRRSEEFDNEADLAIDNWEAYQTLIETHKQAYKENVISFRNAKKRMVW